MDGLIIFLSRLAQLDWPLIILLLFALVLAMFWLLLPFLVNGINRRLDRLIRQNEKILDQLDRLTLPR